jgi:NAD(P)-dependent dehydrogenase (short-subunit alcohol dehydrogenase family)
LGARVCELALDTSDDDAASREASTDAAVERALADVGSVELLAVDGASLFAAGEHDALVDSLEASWNVTRALVNRAFMADVPSPPARRIVYIAPAADGRQHADAARAGLENLARTLSIEWARHAITLVAIAPGPNTPAEAIATLVAYLASPAGAYFSGCVLDLRGPRAGC